MLFWKDKLFLQIHGNLKGLDAQRAILIYPKMHTYIYRKMTVYVLLAYLIPFIFSIKICPSSTTKLKKKNMWIFLVNSFTLMFLETAAVFAPKLADLIAVAVSVKTAPLLDFLVMTVFFDLTLVLKE